MMDWKGSKKVIYQMLSRIVYTISQLEYMMQWKADQSTHMHVLFFLEIYLAAAISTMTEEYNAYYRSNW